MKYVALDRVYKINTKNHGKQETAKGVFEVPQVESLAEAIEFAGGEEKLVEQYNEGLSSGAKNGATAILRNAGEGTVWATILEKAQKFAKEFNPATSLRAGKAKILEGVETLRNLNESGDLEGKSQAELLEILRSTLAFSK